MTKFLKLASLLLIALAVIQPTSLFAQKEGIYKSLKDKADYVFEGEVVKSTGKWNAGKTMIYTEHEIRLSKVFKGDLRNPTIRLITLGGDAEGQFVIGTEVLQLREGNKGLFLAREKPFTTLQGTDLGEHACFANDPAGFFEKGFGESAEVPLGYGAMKKKASYDKVLAEIGEPLIQFPDEPESDPFQIEDCGSTTYNTYAEVTFQNIEVTGNLEKVELDIMIEATPPGTKFGKCEFTLTFPSQVFGENVVQNSLLLVEKGEVVQSTDYAMTVVDQAQNKVKINVSLGGSFTTAYSLTGNIEKLFHCSFNIVNPLGLPNLTADDFKLEGNVWYECHGNIVPFRRVVIKTEGDIVLPNFGNLIGINYHMRKFNYTAIGANQQLRFDVFVNGSELSLFKNAELYIDFGSTAFPANLSMNGNIQITKADLINRTTSIGGNNVANYTVTHSDHAANTVKIVIAANPDVGLGGLAELGADEAFLMQIKVKVNTCQNEAGLGWNDLTNNNSHTYIEAGDEFQYMPITYEGELTSKICGCPPEPNDPVITGFEDMQGNPVAQVSAGTGTVLKIIGNNFRDVISGSSFIRVQNADAAGTTDILLFDIIDWKDTEITFVVPSQTTGTHKSPMASGGVQVITECGESNEEDITVEYSVMNYRPPGSTRAYRLALERQTANGIVFTFSGNVGNFERGLTEHAVNTWQCLTEINWSVGGTMQGYETVSPADNINLVVEVEPDNDFLNNGEAGAIVAGAVNDLQYAVPCNSNNGKVYYTRNIDVVINNNTNFSNMDLAVARRIFLHEFGHAHMLNHASRLFGSGNPQVLMYYTSGNGNNAPVNADINGAESVFAASAELLTGDCPAPIDTRDCANATHDSKYADSVKIYPVPFSGMLVLESEVAFPSGAILFVSDVTGTVVRNYPVGNQMYLKAEGFSSLPSGIYYLQIIGEKVHWASKTIKIGTHE
jgi:hypothetical protein